MSDLKYDMGNYEKGFTGKRTEDAESMSELVLRAADKMAKAIDEAIKRGYIDARCAIADARLDYGEPFKYEFSKVEKEA